MKNAQFPALTQIYETSLTLGIKEVSIISNFELFPNPTETKALISFNLLQDCNATIEIIDMLGNVVYSKNDYFSVGENKHGISIEDYVSGSYFCRLVCKDRQLGVINFVISR